MSSSTHKSLGTVHAPRHANAPDKVVAADLTNPVPDIAEVVTYQRIDGRREQMRVNGWYCLQQVTKPTCQIVLEILRESKDALGFTLVGCSRDQATVLGLTGIAGALVRTNSPELTREGRYVPWPKEQIDEQRESYLSRIKNAGIGRGYRSTLERLFPDTDFSYPH